MQLQEKEIYGLIVIDRKEATVGFLNGTSIQLVANEESLVPSKHHQGGQSSRRYERLIEIAAHEYFKKIGGIINNAFMPVIRDVKAVFIGGPGSTKDFFFERDYLRNEIKQKVKDLFDLGYTDETGLRELVEKASSSVKDMKITREKDLMNRFMMEIKKSDGGLGVYGISAILQALEMKSLDTLLLSEGLNLKMFEYTCTSCGYHGKDYKKKSDDLKCTKCGSQVNVNSEEDLIETFYRMANEASTNVQLISEESDEGKLLLKAFGGTAGILRYVAGATVPQ
ncbi:Peptide chain release factor eRF/aRF subunit 1 [mine drainage metagenome]|uniref:Peptide chain release factor eRF/aRF subunit 1 n=1 Tax=mine drainage metagenome TaxID=410659 RepID=T0Z292_9ZZZZ